MSDNQADGQSGGSPFDDSAQQEVVRLARRTDKDGSSYTHATLTPASDTRPKEMLCDVRPIIPVIFLPGVMGSQLANKETGGELFFAPNTDTVLAGLGALGTLIELWFTGASSREKNFDPTQAAVTPLGPINVGKHGKDDTENQFIDETEARRRGWGSVHRTSYHPILAWLEEQLNEPMHLGEAKGAWVDRDPDGQKWTLKPLLGTSPAAYGALGNGEALTEDSPAFQHFAKFRYRLYAIGYNWLQSNADSAKQVIEGSDYYDPKTKKTTRLMGIKEICAENHTGKAILLTHSMGGLVARMGIAMHGAADFLHGVFHSVQPATGAPVAAKRFRTGGGNEGGLNSFVNGSLLGRDANEFTAVLANAPGPLELIPMPDYINGEPWWIFTRLDGTPVMQLPANGNSFQEIYTNSKWFGLLPDEKLLDPAGIVKARLDKNHETQTVLEHFHKTVRNAVVNQNNIIDLYHERTYAAYGDGALSSPPGSAVAIGSNGEGKPSIEKGEARDALLTWGRVIWKGNMPSIITEEELRTATLLHDSHTGNIRVYLQSHKQAVEFEVQKVNKLPAGTNSSDPSPYESRNGIIAGDGTVPVWSAEAQARGLDPRAKGDAAKGVQMAFVQHGYNHQFSYNHPWTRWAVLYSIVQLAQDAPDPSC
ncbi:alpha/beta hydrolase [Trinickia sp. Y13]|uniref:esterase/lipase family protein n=1 Tax=Trinickia sp. Y13 TaxID=2917807 RepID=UPI0024067BE3|nr:alpha/beta hydrolase [Trinickia sp. Y13]MDG0024972.1 alpha/beta hydrolase [Trinickia sp. Y13]